MTNINCVLPCFFELDGKCRLTHVTALSSTPRAECLYFVPKKQSTHMQRPINTLYNNI
ncbi:hypothetical protein EV214_12939 [Marinisporobacter balticus]|uniref:Uncharacterized protein n=1 Tax=Marinisporobacter balticus TaxID=2018667 RepID=A0A4V2SA05_9FIRM|nr:hypothetical protein EV214_12939 [Marinisporobacter balticus]